MLEKFTLKYFYRDFWQFLKNPTTEAQRFPFSVKLAFQLFIGFFLIRFLTILVEVFGFRPFILSFTGHELARQQIDGNTTSLVVGALISAPIVEELAYRWGLRFSPLRTAVSIGLVVFYWLPYGGTYSTSILRVLNQPGFYLMVGMGVLAGLTAYALFKVPYLESLIRQKWSRSFGWVYYISALLFGLMHIFNVADLDLTILGLAPLITFQQIALGFFNGYVRMRFGLAQAVAQHALFNLVPVLIQLTG